MGDMVPKWAMQVKWIKVLKMKMFSSQDFENTEAAGGNNEASCEFYAFCTLHLVMKQYWFNFRSTTLIYLQSMKKDTYNSTTNTWIKLVCAQHFLKQHNDRDKTNTFGIWPSTRLLCRRAGSKQLRLCERDSWPCRMGLTSYLWAPNTRI